MKDRITGETTNTVYGGLRILSEWQSTVYIYHVSGSVFGQQDKGLSSATKNKAGLGARQPASGAKGEHTLNINK